MSLVNQDAKTVITHLMGLLKQEPTLDDLTQALAETKLNEKHLEKLWESIELDGWDTAHTRAKNKGTEFKSQWGYHTGDNYGAKKADSWVPDGWDEALATNSKENLETLVTAARAELEDAISQNAVSVDALERLRDTAEKLEHRKSDVSDAEKAVQKVHAELQEKEKLRDDLPACEVKDTHECPSCNTRLIIDKVFKGKTHLKIAENINKKQQDELQTQRASLDGQVANCKGRLNEAQAVLNAARVDVKESMDAVEKLSEVDKKTTSNAAVDVDQKREAKAKAERNLNAFTAKTEADRLHRNVQVNQVIIDALDQKGVRKTALIRALKMFNTEINHCCSLAGFGKVEITNDLSFELEGRSYFLLSESEQFRVRVALQVAISRLDKSACLIIDGADILDPSGRKGLFMMLHKMKLNAVIGMMLSKPESSPNLKAICGGVSYWLQNGKSTEIR
ncbi:hypothetical protein [uncultured Kiloniella sp.]|uniref:hypothetical protein n=1 Tax=uncultured Kiloniella sp. TaxID=1133091 RepID=UPI002603C3C6|nr:hypothetical protein [uncultured Kiloniella sp.]